MINYPNKKNKIQKTYINYSNRGMNLESDLNQTNSYYLESDIAIIHKKPTPVKVLKINRNTNRITNAYYEKPSTTDYNGIYKGFYIDYEAKEINSKTSFPLSNIHKHQIDHLMNVFNKGGISFVIVSFKTISKVFIYEIKNLYKIYSESLRGGVKSISIKEFEKNGYLIKEGLNPRLDYIRIIDKIIKKD